MLLKPGVYEGLSFEDYIAIGAMNNSRLRHMAISGRTYQHRLNNPTASTSAMELGRIVHALNHDLQTVLSEYSIYGGKVRRGKQWDLHVANNPGKTHLLQSQWDVAVEIAEALKHDDVARPYFNPRTKREVTVVWEHQSSGILCKARLDSVEPGRFIADLKSTKSATPTDFARDAFRYGYHRQAAFYADGWLAATGEELPFSFVCVCKEAPFEAYVVTAGPRSMAAGREQYEGLLNKLSVCRKHNEWPGVAEAPVNLDDVAPSWALPKEAQPEPEWVMGDEDAA